MTNEKPNYLMASVILTLLRLSITPSFGAINSEKVVGAAACYDCHISEYEGWQATAHFKAYNTLHRSSEAKDIAGKLNIKGNLRRASRCMTCHYTTQGAIPVLLPATRVNPAMALRRTGLTFIANRCPNRDTRWQRPKRQA